MQIDRKREDFISQYPPLNTLNKREKHEIWEKEEIHLYLHIPYCKRKCGFCYYKSFPLMGTSIPDEYIEYLKKEIVLYSQLPETQDKIVRSIYWGGGTPTLLEEKQIETLYTCIKNNFTFHKDYEFCCEGRPGTETDLSKLRLLNELGMKRLSLGCQSTDEDVLRRSGRNHTAEEFFHTFELARKADTFSINVDIMTGMVGQSLESWLNTVEDIIQLRPENIAVYKMEIYLNSGLYKHLRANKINLISDENEETYAREGYKRIIDSGYDFADNFSFNLDEKYDHVHRRETWKGAEMIGIGLSSHSCFNDFIYQNEIDLQKYYQKLEDKEIPIFRAHKISKKEEMIQRLVFGIKNLRMCRLCFEKEFGIDLVTIFQKGLKLLEENGYISIHPDKILTTFEGALYADDIVRVFYLPEHEKMMLGHISRASLCS